MIKPFAKKLFRLLPLLLIAGGVAAFVGLHVLDRVFPFPVHRIQDRLTTSSAILLASDHSLLSWRVDAEENRRLSVSLDAVSPWLVEATIAVEDKRFRSHCGIDPIAVLRALGQNLSAGRRVSGASTITMQTIRLLWPRPRRLDSKLVEAFRAWQLERLVGKDRVLEIYFSLAPYGGNVIGAEAAARHYFGKSAAQLNLAEACLLAGIPQSPARLNPSRHPQAARARRDFVAHRLAEDGRISRERARRIRREGLELVAAAPRVDARHFADLVLAEMRHANAAAVTTLAPDIQRTVAELAGRRAAALSARGVAGPAVVVLSAADSSVLGYVGNASAPGTPAREIDAARARRQPGSLLKPFIFALLAGQGKIAPSSRVYDLPKVWSGYAPRNMDREWRGGLAASDALRQSRNVTAVSQLETLGTDAFAAFMHGVGLEPGQTGRDGLAVALGAKEQNLLAVTNAYACLARMGRWLPPRLHAGQTPPAGRVALSPGAAWLTLSALAPPEESREPRMVWKTGTSWNQQDAWAVALTPELVVGVWCGRLGRGDSGWVAGGEEALPLALEVLEAVSGDGRASWPPPREIAFHQVCVESGALPGWNCRETMTAPLLVGNHAGQFCREHAAAAREAVASSSPAPSSGGRLRIVSPSAGTVYVAGGGAGAAVPLLAEGSGAGELHWFADGRSLGAGKPGAAKSWPMRPGRHRLSVSDGDGRSAAVEVTVEAW